MTMNKNITFIGLAFSFVLVAVIGIKVYSFLFSENLASSDVSQVPTKSMLAIKAPKAQAETVAKNDVEDGKLRQLETSSQTHIDAEEADFRYDNLVRLMSLSVTGMEPFEKSMLMEQVLNELPKVVKSGRMHPFDAMVAHTQILKRQEIPYDHERMEALQAQYMSTYPLTIRQTHAEIH